MSRWQGRCGKNHTPYEHPRGLLFVSLSVTMRSFKHVGRSILNTNKKALILQAIYFLPLF
jgi:hypothetical protein